MGSYVENNLMTGEEILYRAKLHLIIFFGPVVTLLISFLLFGSGDGSLISIGAFLFLVAIAAGIGRMIIYKTSEFAITNKRVIIKTGLIKRTTLETMLLKIEGIMVDQNIPGRMLGYGTVVLIGTGGTKYPYKGISSPMEFRKRVQEKVAELQS